MVPYLVFVQRKPQDYCYLSPVSLSPVTQELWFYFRFLKAHSGLRQFLATESPLKMMKNALYFTSKAPFVLKIFKFLS